MKVKVKDLMSKSVVTAQPHNSVATIKAKMTKHKLNSIPVVSTDHKPVGIVSAADIVAVQKAGLPISKIMTENVYTVPDYDDVAVAARIMRNHRIHHLIVTSEKQLTGIISSFDLLKLVEGHRFEMKNPSTPKSRGRGKRARAELE
ncbi:MAG: CBS domain-containing protein [Thiotrichales bacterium]|nr:MAG: CBS domain-containing protein [Thiotrichales bacterium]